MTTLREQVREFHLAMNVPADTERPTIIPDDRVRLRAALIAEEFFEVLASMFAEGDVRLSEQAKVGNALTGARAIVFAAVEQLPIGVDMVELADGFADLDYVVEGSRLEFGIDGAPIAAEVHRANMAKVGGPIAPNGKRLKPAGWTPPDIEVELRRQGYGK
jgi:predicted HAD superfamily Cof-like phosphohydrolase